MEDTEQGISKGWRTARGGARAREADRETAMLRDKHADIHGCKGKRRKACNET